MSSDSTDPTPPPKASTPDTPDFSPEAIAELRSKWERYADRLREGDGGGSLVGAAYIIAKTAVADIPALLAALEASERENERLKRLAEAYRAYAEFLGEEVDRDCAFLYTHGIEASQATADRGVELRAEIAAAGAALAPSTPPDPKEDA